MNKETILGIVRHTLTAVGGGFVTNGVATSDEISAIIGGIVTLAGVIWSVIAKRSAK